MTTSASAAARSSVAAKGSERTCSVSFVPSAGCAGGDAPQWEGGPAGPQLRSRPALGGPASSRVELPSVRPRQEGPGPARGYGAETVHAADAGGQWAAQLESRGLRPGSPVSRGRGT